jgi:afadin
MVKNEKKRQSKRDKKKQNNNNNNNINEKENKSNVAEDLYKEVPDSNFTRSISNPEIVMARRRQQKLEQKLKQIKNRDGGMLKKKI